MKVMAMYSKSLEITMISIKWGFTGKTTTELIDVDGHTHRICDVRKIESSSFKTDIDFKRYGFYRKRLAICPSGNKAIFKVGIMEVPIRNANNEEVGHYRIINILDYNENYELLEQERKEFEILRLNMRKEDLSGEIENISQEIQSLRGDGHE